MLSSRSRRGWWQPAVAAATVAALAIAAATVARDSGSGAVAAPTAGGWQAMAPAPLEGRLRPVLQGWGDKVVVVGGRIERPCPPNAGCVSNPRPTERDGALYDVPTDTWEQLPDAPLPLDVSASDVLDDTLYLWLPGVDDSAPRVLALDLVERRWTELTPSTEAGGYRRLVAAGDRLVAYAMSHTDGPAGPDLAYLPAENRWEQLPPDPFLPSFDRTMVWADDRLVLVTAAELEKQGPPFLRAAVLEGASWRELPEQEVVIGGSGHWSWTGSRVVSASTYTADGGETNPFGRSYPAGGELDPATGSWTELPAPPEPQAPVGSRPWASSRRWVTHGEGLVLDTQQRRWLGLPEQPDRADQDSASAWAAGRLVVWGGAADVDLAGPEPAVRQPRLLATGAVWTPPQG